MKLTLYQGQDKAQHSAVLTQVQGVSVLLVRVEKETPYWD